VVALELWKQLPPLDLKSIPLIVGIRFTRTIKQEDMNLQLFENMKQSGFSNNIGDSDNRIIKNWLKWVTLK
jgi:hypothetical protein